MRPGAVSALPAGMLEHNFDVRRIDPLLDEDRKQFFEFLASKADFPNPFSATGEKWLPRELAAQCDKVAAELKIPATPLLLLWLFVALTDKKHFDHEFSLCELLASPVVALTHELLHWSRLEHRGHGDSARQRAQGQQELARLARAQSARPRRLPLSSSHSQCVVVLVMGSM